MAPNKEGHSHTDCVSVVPAPGSTKDDVVLCTMCHTPSAHASPSRRTRGCSEVYYPTQFGAHRMVPNKKATGTIRRVLVCASGSKGQAGVWRNAPHAACTRVRLTARAWCPLKHAPCAVLRATGAEQRRTLHPHNCCFPNNLVCLSCLRRVAQSLTPIA